VEGNSLIAYRVKSHRIKRYLYEAGFNGFLELQNKQHNRDLIDLLVKSFDPLTKTFHIGGSVFRVTAADVERVYGLPSSGQEVDIETCCEKYVHTFSREVKLDRNQGMVISFRQLKDKLRSTKDSPRLQIFTSSFALVNYLLAKTLT
ncbi:hypothetical protein LINGRAHAP2_LOCUS15134, partial [Linum grandiflorum]